jgi:methyl-accepting chemotaxis protein
MKLWSCLYACLSRGRARRLSDLAEEVAGHWPHLPALEAQIRETIQEVESSVVQVCGAFEGMATRSRESVAAANQLLGSGQGSGIETLLEASRHSLGQLREQIGRGQRISSQLIERMKTLENSAGVIVKALGEIDRIAMGSKLVALNAKVEAAHFGDQGAAFEVVADEIAAHARRSEEITGAVAGEMKELRATVAATSGELDEMAHMSVETLEATRRELEGALAELTRTHTEMEAGLSAAIQGAEQLAVEISRSIMGLQFQDRVTQRLSHVADEIGAMRKTVHIPLEFLKNETPVLGAKRSKAVGERLAARYTMHSERTVLAGHAPAPDKTGEIDNVELF